MLKSCSRGWKKIMEKGAEKAKDVIERTLGKTRNHTDLYSEGTNRIRGKRRMRKND
jgi:hypothetical protein